MSIFRRPPRGSDRPGEVLCRLVDIPDGQGRGFELEDDDGGLRGIFLVRQGDSVVGYANVCPHAGTPLDTRPDTFIAPDAPVIQCATHGARFAIADGRCLSGPCAGRGLAPEPVGVDSRGRVVLHKR